MNRTPVLFLVISGVCLVLTGCNGAPALDVIGSFFPAWMVCLIISIVLTGLLRVLLVRRQLEQAIQPVALFYPAVVLLLCCLLWLIFYR
jgi:YtcA-like protein